MNNLKQFTALFVCFLGLICQVLAEDIDLFTAPKASTNDVPNALFVFDTAGSFNSNAPGTSCEIDGTPTALSGKVGGIEQCAIHAAISALDVTKVNIAIGVMGYNGSGVKTATGAACPGSGNQREGGCLLFPLTRLDTTSKPNLLAWIKSWNTGNAAGAIQSNNEKFGASMQEAWAYYAGRMGLSGVNYSASKPPVGCSKNFVIFVGNAFGSAGTPGDSTGEPRTALEGSFTGANALMNAYPAATSNERTILLPTTANSSTMCGPASVSASSVPSVLSQHETKGFYGDEWARYMAGQNISTYSIGILNPAQCQPEYAWQLQSMATVGGGKYFPTTDLNELKLAFQAALSEVQSVNSAFASVSLPVSVNTQGTYLNQVFIGMFRPDPNSLPRWYGNLKQYKMGYPSGGGAFQMLDADNQPAISSSGTDFLAECARSFWTPPLNAPDDYWSTLTTANCSGYATSSNTPDGNLVEKGGQAFTLRASNPANRIVKTCPLGSGCTSLSDFQDSNTAITLSALGATSAGERTSLINWARGMNVKGESGRLADADLTLTQMRPSVHGDVVHSRPVAINFGTDSTPQVVVLYGANDGMLRAINGNRNAAIGSIGAGGELWSFMPPEFYGKIKRLYNNTSTISSPNVSGSPKDYGMDGSVAAYVIGANDSTSDPVGDAWVFASMRRGGRTMYAFKVSKSSPSSITSKWKIGCDSSGCFTTAAGAINNADFSGIGQTWATPKVFRAAGYGAGKSPLLVFGGGYDDCEDASVPSCDAIKGNHIYIVDADTGRLLKDFSTVRGVTGDILMLQDSSGKATYGYASDLGGNLYRISGIDSNTPIESTPPENWSITRIASLGCAAPGSCTSPANRKFIFGPDVVVEGGYNILLIGSGDREKPVNYSNTVENYFFMVKDKPSDLTWLSDEGGANGRCGSGNNLICMASLTTPILPGSCTAPSADTKGWALKLTSTEQVVTSAITVGGVVYFSTHQPVQSSAESCSANLGRARAYAISYLTAASPQACNVNPYVVIPAGGLPPSPVAGRVVLDDGTIVPFVIGAKGPLQTSPVQAPGLNPKGTKIRSYWHIQK